MHPSNQFARACLSQSLIELMQTHDYSAISITQIVQKAGVSRMTYYRNFNSKEDILRDYMDEIIAHYIEDIQNLPENEGFQDYSHIRHCLEYFKNYSDFVLCLAKANLTEILLNGLNSYMLYAGDADGTSFAGKCRLYYYAGALYNVYMQWLKDGMREDLDVLAQIIYEQVHGRAD